jgi:hypothetical protein
MKLRWAVWYDRLQYKEENPNVIMNEILNVGKEILDGCEEREVKVDFTDNCLKRPEIIRLIKRIIIARLGYFASVAN